MLDKLRAEYKEAQAKLARREQLRVMLNDAAAQLNEITVRERALYEQLQKENADVDVMERTTVTSVFYTLLGKKEEKLEKEQREAQAAKLAYQAVTRELADCRDRIDAMMNGKTGIPLKAWKTERDKLNGEKKQLTGQYYALKDEVKEVEQIRRNVYSILREENGRKQPTRKHEIER